MCEKVNLIWGQTLAGLTHTGTIPNKVGITINKSKGYMLDFVSIWLCDENLFRHGQLYESHSRVSSFKNIEVALYHPNRKKCFFLQVQSKEVVFKKFFYEKSSTLKGYSE